MRQEAFTLSQKELQRVSVISTCIKGDMACARAAGLLCLSVRQIKRLKKRMREDGEAALAHANRGRPSHRRLPDAVGARIVQLSRTTYAGFNDHHLCEKLVEREGFTLSRETLRRLLRKNGLGSPLWACRMTPPGKSWPHNSSLRKPRSAISACCANCCAVSAYRWLFTAITAASSSATMTTGQWKNSWPENVSPPSSAGPCNNWA